MRSRHLAYLVLILGALGLWVSSVQSQTSDASAQDSTGEPKPASPATTETPATELPEPDPNATETPPKKANETVPAEPDAPETAPEPAQPQATAPSTPLTGRQALLGAKLQALANSSPLEVDDDASELRKLMIERYNVALAGLHETYDAFVSYGSSCDPVFDAGRRLVEARLALAAGPAEQVQILSEVHAILVELEQLHERRVAEVGGGKSELLRVRYARLNTEVDLAKLRNQVAPAAQPAKAPPADANPAP